MLHRAGDRAEDPAAAASREQGALAARTADPARTTFGYNSAQIGWLEGRLYDLLAAAGDAHLHNGNRPSDETLPAHERLALEAGVAPISRVLRLIGYDPASPGDQPAPGVLTTGLPKKTAVFYGITVQDLLNAGHLTPGTTLTSTNGAWPATATCSPTERCRSAPPRTPAPALPRHP